MRTRVQVAAAALRADGEDADLRALSARLATFRGLPHRLALVHEANGVRWFDDSKATTPAATLFAVESFPNTSQIHLIAGGVSKGFGVGGGVRAAWTVRARACMRAAAPALTCSCARVCRE